MRKATFTVVNATKFSNKHNSRLIPPDYLIEHSTDHYKFEMIHYDQEYKEEAKCKYRIVKKQKMQQKQVDALIKETVLSTKAHHTINDIKQLFKLLNQKYGGHIITSIFIHNDEGYFEKDGISFYKNKHIFKINNEWFIIPLKKFLDENYIPKPEDAIEKIDINEYKKIYNHHAHVKFSMFDIETGQTGRMRKGQLGERLKFVADFLGLLYEPSSKKLGRTTVREIKQKHNVKRSEKITTIFEQQKLQKIDNTLNKYFSKDLQNLSIIEKIQYIIKEYKNLHTQLQTLSKEKQELENSLKQNSNLSEVIDDPFHFSP